ncbi:hypothetical protein MNBD_GAMMA06-350 [hydrothermal vent metagenome]|uniref:8-oxo-dGTP diphosphatase n=1 Tax=hydrothermal vent metagenome TaxID=652676 RepID=A0A3B0WJX2_9ZZZZ
MSDIVHVAVAVIMNKADEVCIGFRPENVHQGGLWEFPGGKIKRHETVEQALIREIKEELNLDIKKTRPLISIPHNYRDKKVVLHVRKVLAYDGQAVGAEGQQIKWVRLDQLHDYEFPAANISIIKAIQLPDKYLITGNFPRSLPGSFQGNFPKNFPGEKDFLTKLENSLNNKIQLVQLRLKQGDIRGDMQAKKISSLVQQTSSLCVQHNAKLLFNIPDSYLRAIDLENIEFDGFHADSRTLMSLSQRTEEKLFSASCHNKEELLKAMQLKADFAVLSPVQKTASHPELSAMGWSKFSDLLENCTMPVYALGGVSGNSLQEAWQHGAQGVAAISAFWH